MIGRAAFTATALALLGLAAAARAAPRETGFLDRTVKLGPASYKYQVYVPQGWSKDRLGPVILFLHGAGERGEDGLFQTEVGLGRAIRRHPDRFPAVVVFPQCRAGVWWNDPAMESQALAALDAAMREFRGDSARVYFMGISLGG